jgi:hypothetical protein
MQHNKCADIYNETSGHAWYHEVKHRLRITPLEHKAGTANRVAHGTNLGCQREFKIFIKSFNIYFSTVRYFVTVSGHFLLSQLVQLMGDHNRNLIISIRVFFYRSL